MRSFYLKITSVISTLLTSLFLFNSIIASPIGLLENVKRDTAPLCSNYIIIQARGTGEAQGPSAGFAIMNTVMMLGVSGGNQYFVQYPAAIDQDSSTGTQDIIEKVAAFSTTFPNDCLILQGYSQGAAATVEALASLNGTSANAIKGILLIGNPLRKPNLPCNVNGTGGTSNIASEGIETQLFPIPPAIPDQFINRTLDICIVGDGICDTQSGSGYGSINQHSFYAADANVQALGNLFMTSMLIKGTFESVIL